MVASAWQIRGKKLQLSRPLIMGILNLSPDSFYAGSRLHGDADKTLATAEQMVAEGADILDLGGESSRPGSDPISADEEIRRVLPPLRLMHQRLPEVLISIDTYKAEVARAALDAGADIVNDISAARFDPQMLPFLQQTACGYVLMHMQGTPRDMQLKPHYENVVREVASFLEERLAELAANGVARERVVVDPGIGFGKRVQDNLTLIARADELQRVGRPLMYGASRKSFLGAILAREAEERLSGTTAVHAILLQQGVSILRVHDVAAARDAVLVHLALQEHTGDLGKEDYNDAG